MSFVVSATIGLGYESVIKPAFDVLTGKAQRDALEAQQNAQRDQIAADARAKAEAETGAAVEANTLRVSQKRAQRANVLALGDGTSGGGALGQSKSVLAMGASPAQAGAAASTTSVLGGGAPITSSASPGRVPTPVKPTQGIA